MYYSAIGLLAVLILFIVNWDILRNPQVYEKPAWNVYRRFLFAVLIYYITDIAWGLLEAKKLSTALFVDTCIYFVAMAVGISFWAEYSAAYLEMKGAAGRAFTVIGRVIAGVIICLTAINIFKPVLFTVDKDSVYTALPSRYVMLVCQILFLVAISVYALAFMFRSGNGHNVRYRILASFGIFMALFLFIQLWFPYLPLYSIAYMLGTCLLHAFVVSDEKEDYKRELEEAKAITELKDRFSSLLDNIPGMTFTKDARTGKYLACNQAFADYAHKIVPAEVVGLTDAQIFDAETAAHFMEDDKIALSLSKPYIFYEDVLDAEGNPKQLQTTKIKYTDTAGRLCVLGVCQDISDLVRIEHEQAKTKEAYENAVSTGLMYTHIAQTLARDYAEMYYVNTDTEEFVEYRKEEGGGSLSEIRRGWHFFSDIKAELCQSVYVDDREHFSQIMKRKNMMKALGEKDTFITTYRRMVDGKPVYVSMKVSTMENDEKYIIIGFMNVDADIRDAMAKNEALSEALYSAEAANNAKTMFLSGMSHEIRTPINAVIGLSTLALKNDSLDDRSRGYFEKIGDSAHSLLSIINDILDMSRIEAGQAVLNKHEFSLGTLLDQINAAVMPQCNEKNISYDCNILNQMDDSYVGDDMKLKDILLNILSNAVKFTEESGSVTLTVEETAKYADQSTLCFKIRDTGIGMDKEFIPKIFDVFSREDNGNKPKTGSAGLGMAIIKRMVDMMNGTISVESEKGVGTEFTVMVTMVKGSKNVTDYSSAIDLQALYVLVVDDNPIESEHAKMVLEEVGIHADCCTSGQEALLKMEVQHTKQHPYNLVLMDWNMPGMNGKEASVEVLKKYEKECTVVAMTAYSWDDIREEAGSIGVLYFMEKPLFAATIIDNISQIAYRSNMAIFKEKKKARLEGRRILLAEDVEINAEIMVDMLDMEGVKVDHAENGKIAVKLFEDSTAGIYSAILMDVRMPEMDGLEATRVIRAMEREDAKRIPIIALTANAFDEDVQNSLQAGMNAHLNKPVEAESLIRTLGELIYEAEESITGR